MQTTLLHSLAEGDAIQHPEGLSNREFQSAEAIRYAPTGDSPESASSSNRNFLMLSRAASTPKCDAWQLMAMTKLMPVQRPLRTDRSDRVLDR
jgi:hypothetical protein